MLSHEQRERLTAKARSLAANVGKAQNYLTSRGIPEDVAALYDLGYADAGDFAGRLSVPYVTPAGVVAIKYRCIDDRHPNCTASGKCPKYLNEPGLGTHLYNARSLIGLGDRVLLLEGEIDVITVEGVLEMPAVGYPGTESWKGWYRYCFDSVSEVVVIADGDDPGRKAAEKVRDKIGTAARVVEMPPGHDANSFINSEGGNAFVALVEEF